MSLRNRRNSRSDMLLGLGGVLSSTRLINRGVDLSERARFLIRTACLRTDFTEQEK
jgi:hypothetical protein